MARQLRWDPCVAHRGAEVGAFITEYFSSAERRILFVAGAGFDPRSTAAATRISAASQSARALLFQENRPNPPRDQIERASANISVLSTAIKDHKIVQVEIFGSDGAVVGGRNVVAVLSLSIGVQF